MKKVVVLTGAGISAESGLKTFRDSDGLWENYRVEDVATPGAWHADYQLVLQFYNERRKQVLGAKPNAAHIALAELEKKYQVDIITQNIDDLHERSGSTRVLHLHGEILKSRSTVDAELVYPIEGWKLKAGDRCEKGSQLRPHIVPNWNMLLFSHQGRIFSLLSGHHYRFIRLPGLHVTPLKVFRNITLTPRLWILEATLKLFH
jgi:NAD-dependent deacetylase